MTVGGRRFHSTSPRYCISAGKPAEASAAATEAATLFDQKGSTVGLAQAHRFLAELAAT
jgi:hypothetical protein